MKCIKIKLKFRYVGLIKKQERLCTYLYKHYTLTRFRETFVAVENLVSITCSEVVSVALVIQRSDACVVLV